jgi:response regulator RpfG family c-di-GMP phosphodiesterase
VANGVRNMSEKNEDDKPRILIADDDPEIRAVLFEFLGRAYACTAVHSAEAALAIVGRQKFSLVITDIRMGGMSGLQMVPHVQACSPETVVIFISGAQAQESAVEALRAGVFDYLIKPFDLQQVEVAVSRALEHQRLLAGRRHYERQLEEQVRQRTAELGRALGSLEGAYRATLRALVAALEARDTDTRGHSERVVAFSLRLGRELGLGESQLRSLEFGSLLHDIGKIGIPDAVLRKPAALDDDEWATMRRHPSLGRQILSEIEFLEGAALLVGQHHEKWDGTGYPQGLRGEEIDLGARIFSVADAFDAITSDRVYRRGKSYEEAAAELERCAGTHFDPAVVAAFRRVPPEDWDRLRALAHSRLDAEMPAPAFDYAAPRAASPAPRQVSTL